MCYLSDKTVQNLIEFKNIMKNNNEAIIVFIRSFWIAWFNKRKKMRD